MVGCDILDFRCIFVNELIGDAGLAMLFVAILFFVFSSKIKLGFRTTVVAIVPFILIFGLGIAGFSALYAFITILVGIMIATIFNKIMSGR